MEQYYLQWMNGGEPVNQTLPEIQPKLTYGDIVRNNLGVVSQRKKWEWEENPDEEKEFYYRLIDGLEPEGEEEESEDEHKVRFEGDDEFSWDPNSIILQPEIGTETEDEPWHKLKLKPAIAHKTDNENNWSRKPKR